MGTSTARVGKPACTAAFICCPFSYAVPESTPVVYPHNYQWKWSPLSKNICFTCLRCFFVSPGRSNWTSERLGVSLFSVTFCDWNTSECTDTPDVDRSTRFCSVICCCRWLTSSCRETEKQWLDKRKICKVGSYHRIPCLSEYSWLWMQVDPACDEVEDRQQT